VIPLALAACCERVDMLRVSELMDYSTYEDPGFTGVFFGFGRSLDYAAPLLQPGVLEAPCASRCTASSRAGSPSFRCEIEPVGEDGDHNTAGILGTAMRVLNAIPVVCDAPPGVVSILDLPLFTGRGA